MPSEGPGVVSHICQAYPDRVEVRGRDLTGDLMGRLTFTEYFHLLLTGQEPSDDERYFLDLLLVAIAEHGMMPTNVAARMTLAADPGSLQGAVAAGILGCGPVILGTSEDCALLLERAQGGTPVREIAGEIRAARRQGAGLRPPRPQAARPARRADPRAGRRARRQRRVHVRSRARSARPSHEAWGRPLTMNVAMPIAAVMLDLGFPRVDREGGADPRPHRGLLAHLAEEREQPHRLPHGRRAEEAVEYQPPPR